MLMIINFHKETCWKYRQRDGPTVRHGEDRQKDQRRHLIELFFLSPMTTKRLTDGRPQPVTQIRGLKRI